jgi:predicted RNA-binding protein with PIN domain
MLYLFDGHNILHAGNFADERELVDVLAGFVALQGARGVVVFDGYGESRSFGPLEVRYAAHADDVLERLAAEHRTHAQVRIVSSDRAVRRTAGQEVSHVSATNFLKELATAGPPKPAGGPPRTQIGDALDEETQARLEAWRRRRH